MKIIIASSDSDIVNVIPKAFNRTQLLVVNQLDDFMTALKTGTYNFIVTDYYFDGIDVWQLAKLINSTKLAPLRLPIHLIKESNETNIPLILAKEHGFQVTATDDLYSVLSVEFAEKRYSAKSSILVIEDDENAADVVFCALRDHYDIDICTDGLSGLQTFIDKRHDLVLLDYMLPGLKGDEVLLEIMSVDEFQPVIVMTAFDQPENNREFILNGASQYLTKPFSINELRFQCGQAIAKSKLIVQSTYHELRLREIRTLIDSLESQVNQNQKQAMMTTMSKLKLILPINAIDDELSQWHLES